MNEAKQQKFIAALTRGEKLSKQDALKRFGIWNSGHIVWKLRKSGVEVKTEMIERKGERYAVYSL